MSAHACVNVFHPTSSSTILWLSSDQKFQQPKYIIHKNKIKLNRTDDVCRTKKTRYTIKIYTIAYTRFFVAIDKHTNSYQPIHILPNLYSHNAFSIPNFFFCLFFSQSIHFIYKYSHMSSSANTWKSWTWTAPRQWAIKMNMNDMNWNN